MKAQMTAIPVLVTASVISATAFAQSQLPYVFQAGQPARAAEVNENFDALDQRIQQLEADTSTVSAQVLTAIPLASETRYLFDEYYQFKGSFPLDNDAAGALAPADIQNDFISSVAITGNKVVATFGNNADPAILNDTLEFIPNISGGSIYFTCNPTGGVIAFFDPDYCVIADEPPEPLATIREQVASAIELASEARWMVVDYYEHIGTWPIDNAIAGVEVPDLIRNAYVQNVTVRFNNITVLFGREAHPVISGEIMFFTATDNLGSRVWFCAAPNISGRYTGFSVRSEGCVLPPDEPPQPAVLVRQQVESGLSLAAGIQDLVEEFYVMNGVWPQSNSEAGAPAPGTILNSYVSSVAIGNGGIISIEFANDAYAFIVGLSVTLTPTDNIGSISWACSSLGIPWRFLPYQCR